MFKPFESTFVGNLEIMNECFTIILMYHLLGLSEEFARDEYGRAVVGLSFMFWLFIDLFMNFFFLTKTIIETNALK